MFAVLAQISWLAVLVASVGLMALGALWFVALFGGPYAIALGRTDLKEHKPTPLFFIGPFLCGAVVTIANASLMHVLNVTSYGSALAFGSVVGLGYLVPTTVNVAINPNIPRPLLYGLVSGSYFLVGNLLSCLILAAMS